MFLKKRVQISHVSVIKIAISDNSSKKVDESWTRPTFLQLNGEVKIGYKAHMPESLFSKVADL